MDTQQVEHGMIFGGGILGVEAIEKALDVALALPKATVKDQNLPQPESSPAPAPELPSLEFDGWGVRRGWTRRFP